MRGRRLYLGLFFVVCTVVAAQSKEIDQCEFEVDGVAHTDYADLGDGFVFLNTRLGFDRPIERSLFIHCPSMTNIAVVDGTRSKRATRIFERALASAQVLSMEEVVNQMLHRGIQAQLNGWMSHNSTCGCAVYYPEAAQTPDGWQPLHVAIPEPEPKT